MPARPSRDGAIPPIDALRRAAGPLEEVSERLVRLEAGSLSEVRKALFEFVGNARAFHGDHPKRRPLRRSESTRRSGLDGGDLAWLDGALEEFLGLLRIVEKDDHGGNRQALGQYGRLLAEALRGTTTLPSHGPRGVSLVASGGPLPSAGQS